MGKHIFTTVQCYGCGKPFKTEKLKYPNAKYNCPKCGHKHEALDDEITGGWIHGEFEE